MILRSRGTLPGDGLLVRMMTPRGPEPQISAEELRDEMDRMWDGRPTEEELQEMAELPPLEPYAVEAYVLRASLRRCVRRQLSDHSRDPAPPASDWRA